MSRRVVISYRLDGRRMILDVATAERLESDPVLMREVRRDARLLAARLHHAIDVVDPTDPVPRRILECVEVQS